MKEQVLASSSLQLDTRETEEGRKEAAKVYREECAAILGIQIEAQLH